MLNRSLLVFLLILPVLSHAQLYFPPVSGNEWQSREPSELGWCTGRIDSLYALLETNRTKAFIVLKDGRIVLEKYFGSFTADSPWYWASAGKSLAAFLTGVAQEQGLLSIDDTVSRFLGSGWTSCGPEKERLIRIRHQLTMTTGLDYLVADQDCTDPSCLRYRSDAGTAWFYHNAPYHLLHDVVAAASGRTWQQFTTQTLLLRTGISGIWYDHVFYSKPRSMARFGLLMLGKGAWSTDSILNDRQYYNSMITSSQGFNEAYGYLWWLNGKSSFRLPQSLQTFPGTLVPYAPHDAFAALGKNDQKLYVWPSRNIVVVRMGEAATDQGPVPVAFDTLMWKELRQVMCPEFTGLTGTRDAASSLSVWPNPANSELNVRIATQQKSFLAGLYNSKGEKVYEQTVENRLPENKIDLTALRSGVYTLRIVSGNEVLVKKLVVIR